MVERVVVEEVAEQNKLQETHSKAKILKEHLKGECSQVQKTNNSQISPLPTNCTTRLSEVSASVKAKWKRIGLEAIAQRKCALVTLAGGQGTRLGTSSPKGCFSIGLPSGKSLFQMMAERILKVQELSKSPSNSHIPWLVMVSEATQGDTEQFFEDNSFFGLKKEQVKFFVQGNLPCLSSKEDSSVLMASATEVATSPNGNGGIYLALKDSGLLLEMKTAGICYFQVLAVDNILAKIADPVFFGYCIENSLELGCKSVEKRSASESVGVFCLKSNVLSIAEYSEIGDALAGQLNSETGTLTFNQSNIVNHVFEIGFLERVCQSASRVLIAHKAHKKIPYFDVKQGCIVKPESPNGFKQEYFIFDPFFLASKFGVMQVEREEEFSPLKNCHKASPEDNAITAKRALFALHKKWLLGAGAVVAEGDECEISPLVSYAGEGLEAFAGKEITCPAYISLKKD
jgi:UDP-N-acetylglucosamine/UDP-N-acetylgalactosamine diphosphorylase